MISFTPPLPKSISRRAAIQQAAAAIFGPVAASTIQGAENAPDAKQKSSGFGQAKRVLMIYASGGQSHLDMWDPKPQAPREIRGAFESRPTRTPGMHFCEHMPRLAACSDKFTVLRSMSHQDLDHGSATYLTLTGRYHQRLSSNPAPRPSDYPALGAVLKALGVGKSFPHQAIHLNAPALVPVAPAPGQFGGLLGKAFDPLVIGDVAAGPVAAPGLEGDHVSMSEMRKRLALKQQLDRQHPALAQSQAVADAAELYQQALALLESPAIRQAFNLEAEPSATRDAYGRFRAGQACLLGRRLMEAGAPFVNVIWSHSNRGQDAAPDDSDAYGWDTHNDVFSALKKHLLPRFDLSLAQLLKDLDERGLLDETLVVCWGEFGRAPKVAKEPGFAGVEPGRKHWASAYSIMLAGAGVARGGLVGATDRWGADVVSERFAPWDVTATVLHALGVLPQQHYHDRLGRPFAASIGRPILPLYR